MYTTFQDVLHRKMEIILHLYNSAAKRQCSDKNAPNGRLQYSHLQSELLLTEN